MKYIEKLVLIGAYKYVVVSALRIILYTYLKNNEISAAAYPGSTLHFVMRTNSEESKINFYALIPYFNIE